MEEKAEEQQPIFVMFKMANQPSYVIGQVIQETNTDVILYYPVIVNVYVEEHGMEVITSKYLPLCEGDTVAFMKSSIHAVATPKQNFIRYYLDFMKKWQTSGMEEMLEAKIIGAPPATEKEHALSQDPPSEDERIH